MKCDHASPGIISPSCLSMLLVRALGCLALCGFGMHSQAAEIPESTVAANIGLSSEYISRGLRLSWNRPVVQGGVELAHRSGWYASTWASQVSDKFYANGSLEIDLYGGYRGKFSESLSYDAGLGAYFYPGANYRDAFPSGTYPDKRYDTIEALLSLSYDWFNLKYSHCLTDYYGYDYLTVPVGPWNSGIQGGVNSGQGTRGSAYIEINVNYGVGDTYVLGAHAGRQEVTHSSNLSYNDFKISLGKTFSQGWSASAAVTSTRGADIYDNFLAVDGSGSTMDVGGSRFLATVNKAF